jgi:2,3-bisphosphoglycerate-dependent phosphoglycerate mutase
LARILLIRHCQSTGQSLDSPLTKLGHQQAVALAVWLEGRGIDRIVSSPFERAIDTIRPFARQQGVDVETDARLAERRAGAWHPTVEEAIEAVRAEMADYDLRRGDGETGHEVLARGWPVVEDALGGSNAATALIGHGQMNTHLLTHIDPSFGFAGWRAMTNPDVFEVWRDATGLHFRRLWTEDGTNHG